jgi:acyl carrier protein
MAGLAELESCFVDTFALEPGSDPKGLHFQDIPEWDSIGHMQLIAAIETCFDVMLETQEVLDLSGFDKAVEILARHGIAF